MNALEPTQEYLLVIRGSEWNKNLSPEEIQQVTERWMAWFNGLIEQGKLTASRPLGHSGKAISGKNGSSVTEGQRVESKETIAGYYLINVSGLEEAEAIAREFPGLADGSAVNIDIETLIPRSSYGTLRGRIRPTLTEAQYC